MVPKTAGKRWLGEASGQGWLSQAAVFPVSDSQYLGIPVTLFCFSPFLFQNISSFLTPFSFNLSSLMAVRVCTRTFFANRRRPRGIAHGARSGRRRRRFKQKDTNIPRYSSFNTMEGQAFEQGQLTLEGLHEIANRNGEPRLRSGKQELFENIINQYLR